MWWKPKKKKNDLNLCYNRISSISRWNCWSSWMLLCVFVSHFEFCWWNMFSIGFATGLPVYTCQLLHPIKPFHWKGMIHGWSWSTCCFQWIPQEKSVNFQRKLLVFGTPWMDGLMGMMGTCARNHWFFTMEILGFSCIFCSPRPIQWACRWSCQVPTCGWEPLPPSRMLGGRSSIGICYTVCPVNQ